MNHSCENLLYYIYPCPFFYIFFTLIFFVLYGRMQESKNISQGRMGDIKSLSTNRWKAVKRKNQDIRMDVLTHAREGAEQKSHFSLAFYPLRNIQE